MASIDNDMGVNELGPTIRELADAAKLIHSGSLGTPETRDVESKICDRVFRIYAVYEGGTTDIDAESFFDNVFKSGSGWVNSYIGYGGSYTRRASAGVKVQTPSSVDSRYTFTMSEGAAGTLRTARLTLAKIVEMSGGLSRPGSQDDFGKLTDALSFYSEDSGNQVSSDFSSLTGSALLSVKTYCAMAAAAHRTATQLERLYKTTPAPDADSVSSAIKKFAVSVSEMRKAYSDLLPFVPLIKRLDAPCRSMIESDAITDDFLMAFCDTVTAMAENIDRVQPECDAAVSAAISTISPTNKITEEINTVIAPDTVSPGIKTSVNEAVESPDESEGYTSEASSSAKAISAYMMLFSYVRFSVNFNLPGAADYARLVSRDNWEITPSLVRSISTAYLSLIKKPQSERDSLKNKDEDSIRRYNDAAVKDVTDKYSAALANRLYESAIGNVDVKRDAGGKPFQIQNFGWSVGALMATYMRSREIHYMVDDGNTPYLYLLTYKSNLDPESPFFSDKVNKLLRAGRQLRIWYKMPTVGIDATKEAFGDPSLAEFMDRFSSHYKVETNVAKGLLGAPHEFLRFDSESSLRMAMDYLTENNLVIGIKEAPTSEEQFAEMHGKDGEESGSAIDQVTEDDLPVGGAVEGKPASVRLIADSRAKLVQNLNAIKGYIQANYAMAAVPVISSTPSVPDVVNYANGIVRALGDTLGVTVTSVFNKVLQADCPTEQSLIDIQDKLSFVPDDVFDKNTVGDLQKRYTYVLAVLKKCIPEHTSSAQDATEKYRNCTDDERLRKYIPTMKFGAYVNMLARTLELKSASDDDRRYARERMLVAYLFATGVYKENFSDISLNDIAGSKWYNEDIPVPLYVSSGTDVRGILTPDGFPDVLLVDDGSEERADSCLNAALKLTGASAVPVFRLASPLADRILGNKADNVLAAYIRGFVTAQVISSRSERLNGLVSVPTAASDLVTAIPRDLGLMPVKEHRTHRTYRNIARNRGASGMTDGSDDDEDTVTL